MLIVLMVLVGTLFPVMTGSITTARIVRAHGDVSQLAVAITNFQRDVGPLVYDGSSLRMPQTISSLRVVDVLMSGGDVPACADSVPDESPGSASPGRPNQFGRGNPMQAWTAISNVDRLDEHLRFNGRAYPMGLSGPGTGWNGPYVTTEITGDPWGHAYLINTGFLRSLPPRPGWCTTCAVFVLSAGPNGLIETPFQQPIANARAYGDDIVIRIQ